MDDKLFNIFAGSGKDINNQKLMDYVSGKLSAEDRHDLEKQMSDSQFINDAVDGLEDVKNKKDLSVFVDQLNAELQKNLEKKKKRKQKLLLKDQPLLYLTIIIILLLSIISFVIIKKHLDVNKKSLHTTEQIRSSKI